MYINNYRSTTARIKHSNTFERDHQVYHNNGNKSMWKLAVSIVLFQIYLTTSMNPFHNSYSHNYTYKTYHTYTYEFGNLPRLEGEETVRGRPKDDIPVEIPAFIQEQLRRENIQIENSPNKPHFYHFTEPKPNQNQDVASQQISNGFQHNHNPSPFGEDVKLPEPNLIQQPGGFRKSREDNPTPSPPNTPTPLPKVPFMNSSSCYFGFCENVTNYPEDAIKKLLSNNNAFEAFFKPKVPDISERFNNDFENICTVTKSRLFPKVAKNLLGKEKIVVNVDGRTQAVDSEICRDDAMCRFTEFWPIGYKGKCVQKYVQIPLAVMDENNQSIVTDIFSYPSGCYCACKSE